MRRPSFRYRRRGFRISSKDARSTANGCLNIIRILLLFFSVSQFEGYRKASAYSPIGDMRIRTKSFYGEQLHNSDTAFYTEEAKKSANQLLVATFIGVCFFIATFACKKPDSVNQP